MHKFILFVLAFVSAVVAVADESVRSVRLWENGPAFADRNIGAAQPWESGCYFWWGGAKGYRMSNGVWTAADSSASGFSFKEGTCPSRGKYKQVLQKEGWITGDSLSPKCDAAYVLWGAGWRIPTVSELSDLVAKCDWEWECTNGVFGCRVCGKGEYAAASIFLPAAGDACSKRLDDSGVLGFYWSSEPYPGSMNYAWHLLFSNGGQYMSNGNRDDGYSIRPVRAKESARSDVCDYDVVVCGGSSAAVAAAVAAKEAGARVMLFAPRTYLGEEIAGELNLGEGRETPLVVKKALDKAMVDAGMEFLVGAVVTGTLIDGKGRIAGVVVDSRSGRKTVKAKVVVDATSRANVARLAGAKFAPFSCGNYRFKRRVVSREAPHTEGVSVMRLPGELKVEERMGGWNKKVVGVSSCAIYECSFDLPMQDGSSRSFALAEQKGRDLTWTAEQLDAADTMHFVAPDHVIAKTDYVGVWKEVDAIPLEATAPKDIEGVFVLGALADVPRDVAEEMTKPDSFSVLGRRVGRMAAEAAREVQIGMDVQEKENPLPVLATCDVFVAGAGTGGAPACIAAARGGAKTIICDPLYKMGGVETDSLIGWYCFGNRVGFTAEIDAGIRALGPDGEQTRAEWFRRECRRSGAEVWFGASAAGVVTLDGKVTGVIVVMPGGERGLVACKIAIDATGNAVLPRLVGLPTEFYLDNEGSVQGAGMTPRQLGARYNNTDIGFVDDDDAEDVTFFALRSRMNLPTDSVWDLAQGVGTRDRRHIVGDVYIRPVDVYVGRRYPDTVVIARSNFDSHGQTVDKLFLISDSHRKALFANIPYRAFLPKGIENMLVVGLGISAHRDAMPVLRMQPDVQNQGYAVGTAAAMALADGVTARNIDIKKLQRELVRVRILPEDALCWKDSFPLSDEELQRAVATLPNGYDGFPVLMTDTVRAVPLLRRAYANAKAASNRLAYAHALAVMGDKTGEDDLIAALKGTPWDKGWNFKGMAQFGRCASLQDSYIFALGICKSEKAVATILEKAKMLGPDDAYSHFRAVSLALEKIGDTSAASALASLLDKPGIAGHAVSRGEIPVIEGYTNKAADRERTLCLREITLARGLYRLGDVGGKGRRALESYASDPRKVYANYCVSILRHQ